MAEDPINTQDLAYDLRQRYAKLVGDNMDMLNFSKKQNNYPALFDNIEDLYALTKFKWLPESKDEKVNPFKKTYEDIRKDVIQLSTQDPQAWQASSEDSEIINKIKRSLMDLEMYVYYKMNEANMFGKKWQEDMDEI